MKAEDFLVPACECGECRQAGVSTLAGRRDPKSGKILHGYALKHWYDARDRFLAGRPSKSTERLGKPS